MSDAPSAQERSDLVTRFEAQWRGGRAPSLESFVAAVAPVSAGELSAILRVDLRERWQRGERLAAESYLSRFPQVAADDEAAVDLIYSEFLIRQRAGELPQVHEYATRFPKHAAELTAQIALHAASGESAVMSVSERGTVPWGGNDDRTRGPRSEPGNDSSLQGLFGRYEIIRLLGRGGMGSVYLARDVVLEREVALKIPRVSDGLDALSIERFYREAKNAAQLSHPSLCAVYDVGERDGVPYLALQYIPGETLANVLRERGPLPAREAIEIVCRVAVGLEVAHQAGILHRDLKPSNVMFNERREPMVMDFGLATLHNGDQPRLTTTGAFLGTPAYAAPEQLMGENHLLSPRSDVYSLGAVLFEMLTGRPPFIGSVALVMKQALTDPFPAPSHYQPELPASLDRICRRATARDRMERYGSMLEFVNELQNILPDLDRPSEVKPVVATKPPTAPKPRFGWRWLTVAGVCLVMLALAWIGWSNWGGSEEKPGKKAPLSPPIVEGNTPRQPIVESPVNLAATGLEFNGESSHVDFSTLTYDFSSPLTIEAWVTPRKPAGQSTLLSNTGTAEQGLSLYLNANGHWVLHAGGRQVDADAISDSATRPDALVHVVGIYHGHVASLFIDGKCQSSKGWIEGSPTASPAPFVLGCQPTASGSAREHFFQGIVHCMRLSRGVRYDGNFPPPKALRVEADTIALYDSRQGAGSLLKDLSAHGHDGAIIDVKLMGNENSP